MSKLHFSKDEMAFFEEGDTLSDEISPVEDFSDLDSPRDGHWLSGLWARLLQSLRLPQSESM